MLHDRQVLRSSTCFLSVEDAHQSVLSCSGCLPSRTFGGMISRHGKSGSRYHLGGSWHDHVMSSFPPSLFEAISSNISRKSSLRTPPRKKDICPADSALRSRKPVQQIQLKEDGCSCRDSLTLAPGPYCLSWVPLQTPHAFGVRSGFMS